MFKDEDVTFEDVTGTDRVNAGVRFTRAVVVHDDGRKAACIVRLKHPDIPVGVGRALAVEQLRNHKG